jgi:hypothetical protein
MKISWKWSYEGKKVKVLLKGLNTTRTISFLEVTFGWLRPRDSQIWSIRKHCFVITVEFIYRLCQTRYWTALHGVDSWNWTPLPDTCLAITQQQNQEESQTPSSSTTCWSFGVLTLRDRSNSTQSLTIQSVSWSRWVHLHDVHKPTDTHQMPCDDWQPS